MLAAVIAVRFHKESSTVVSEQTGIPARTIRRYVQISRDPTRANDSSFFMTKDPSNGANMTFTSATTPAIVHDVTTTRTIALAIANDVTATQRSPKNGMTEREC